LTPPYIDFNVGLLIQKTMLACQVVKFFNVPSLSLKTI
jgi:hypothetical protein